jgi:glycine oxidase
VGRREALTGAGVLSRGKNHDVPADILIVGQGLAGTLLAWECERAGIDYAIYDDGHREAASRVGAGIINPITGQRIVKSWRIDTLLPGAMRTYSEIQDALGGRFVRPMRVRRLFANDAERANFAAKKASGELDPYAGEADERGFWIESAAQVNFSALIAAARTFFAAKGRLREQRVDTKAARGRNDVVVLCTGAAALRGVHASSSHVAEADFAFAGLTAAKGEILTIRTGGGLDAGVILNRGHWVLPLDEQTARIGATFVREFTEVTPTIEAREQLEASGRMLLASPFEVVSHHVGLRVTTADRQPVAGRSPLDSRIGIINGLGAKGALLAPMLARQWVNHLTEAVPFDPAVDVARFQR